jgi:hypothetical protein
MDALMALNPPTPNDLANPMDRFQKAGSLGAGAIPTNDYVTCEFSPRGKEKLISLYNTLVSELGRPSPAELEALVRFIEFCKEKYYS